jgi:hypothetical protein
MPPKRIDQAVYDIIERVYPRLKARELIIGKTITGQALLQWVRDNLPESSIGQERVYSFKKVLDEKYPAAKYDSSKDPNEKPLMPWSKDFDWDNDENTPILLELVAIHATKRLAKWVLRMKPYFGWVSLIDKYEIFNPTMVLARKYHIRDWMAQYLRGADWYHTVDLDIFLNWKAWTSKERFLGALEAVKPYFAGLLDKPSQAMINLQQEYQETIRAIHGYKQWGEIEDAWANEKIKVQQEYDQAIKASEVKRKQLQAVDIEDEWRETNGNAK